MKKILITGSAGFIGSHLNDYYLKKKFKVYGVDNLMTGSLENIKHHSKDKNYIFIEHDICNKLKINESIDYILHFASPASPGHGAIGGGADESSGAWRYCRQDQGIPKR